MAGVDFISKPENKKAFNNNIKKGSNSPFFKPLIQPKLTVGPVDDPYEREADTVAEKVMRMSDADVVSGNHSEPVVQKKCAHCHEEEKILRKEGDEDEHEIQLKPAYGIYVQRKCNQCRKAGEPVLRKTINTASADTITLRRKCTVCKQEENIQRKPALDSFVSSNFDCVPKDEKPLPVPTLKTFAPSVQKKSVAGINYAPAAVVSKIEATKDSGQKIDRNTLSFMNERFGADFSKVKIHTGTEAAYLNNELGARAFTVGGNIYFNTGEYDVKSVNGKRLLAHELTHVLQQNHDFYNNGLLSRKENNEEAVNTGSVCSQYAGTPPTVKESPQSTDNLVSTGGDNSQSAEAVPLKEPTPAPKTKVIIDKVKTISGKSKGKSTANKKALKMPDDKKFVELIDETQSHSKKQQKHAKPEEKTVQAVDAVRKDANPDAIKQGATILSVEDSVKKEADVKSRFDAEQFKKDLKEQIFKVIPNNEKDAKQLINNKSELDKVTGSANKRIKTAGENITSGVKQIENPGNVNTADFNSKIQTGAGKSYEPEKPGARPVISQPARAIPKPMDESDMQMDKEHDADSLDRAMSERNVTDNQLAESEEPKFLDTLGEKQNSQKELCKVPAQLRQAETQLLGNEAAAAQKVLNSTGAGMNNVRKNNFGLVEKKQGEVKTEGDLRLEEYYTDIQNLYAVTKANVENQLEFIDCGVNAIFQQAVDVGFTAFKQNVTDRLDYYYDWHIVRRDYEKEDKMTRVLVNDPIDAEIRRLKFLQLTEEKNSPQWNAYNREIERLQNSKAKLIIEQIFDEEKQKFTDTLDQAIDLIAVFVADGLNYTKQMITNARVRMDGEYNQLDEENKKKAEEATKDFEAKFTDLESKVNEKENDLKEGLVKKYTESVAKLKDTFEDIRKEAAMSWWEKAWRKIKEIVTIIIDIGKLLLNVLVKAAGVIGDILAHPIRFFGNLIEGVATGFKNFVKRLPEHLENIIFKLILGVVPPNLTLPDKWDAKGIFSFVLGFLGLSKENIRAQAVTVFTEPVVQKLEQAFDLFIIFKNEGFAGLWEHLMEKIGDLKSAIIEEVKTFFRDAIIKAAIEFLLSALMPASGFIKVCKAIIGIVTFLIKNLVNLLKLLDSILDSFADLAAGKLDRAAARVETALENILLIGIKFLAALIGINLDKIQAKIEKIINAVRNPVNRAIQWFLEKAKMFAEKTGLLGVIKKGQEKFEAGKQWASDKAEKGKEWVKDKAASGKEKVKTAVQKIIQWWKIKKELVFGNGEKHTLYFEGEGENAALMMRSTPQTYKAFVKSISITTTDAVQKKKQEDAKAEALIVAGEIDALGARSKTVNNTKDISPDFKKKLDKLAKLTAIFTSRQDGKLPVSSAPVYGSLQNGFATSMKIDMLTKLGPPGTSVNVENPVMVTLKKRLEKTRSYYIAGHLLNHNLHGTGDNWQNLTPLTQTANREHLRSIEASLKSAVANGRAFRYSVAVQYGRTINQQLIRQIEQVKDSQAVTKKEIVQAEQYVPFGITGKVEEIDYTGKLSKNPNALNLDLSVVNSIDQSGPDAYNVKK